MKKPVIGIIMGSQSDMKVMKESAEVLDELEVPFELNIVSAHRTPDRMAKYAESARRKGLKVIIAGAGGAAHLPGMVASMTTLPVILVICFQNLTVFGVQMPVKIPSSATKLIPPLICEFHVYFRRHQ